jgi:hypothetical protein
MGPTYWQAEIHSVLTIPGSKSIRRFNRLDYADYLNLGFGWLFFSIGK